VTLNCFVNFQRGMAGNNVKNEKINIMFNIIKTIIKKGSSQSHQKFHEMNVVFYLRRKKLFSYMKFLNSYMRKIHEMKIS
jgi:hypothetical protein